LATDKDAISPKGWTTDVKVPGSLRRGDYVARFATSNADVVAAQRARHTCFVQGAGRAPLPEGIEADRFDEICHHVLIEDGQGRLTCCYRVLVLDDGAQVSTSYSAQFYDLQALESYAAPMVELGRFCMVERRAGHDLAADGDVLRLAWGMLAAFVDARGAGMLFGCASFAGTDPAVYAQAFDLLAARHLAPSARAPRVKSAEYVPYALHSNPVTDQRVAMVQMPALLKTYLAMGGWVSDHAVIDRDMNTVHVFTGVEIADIPAARAKALRAVAG